MNTARVKTGKFYDEPILVDLSKIQNGNLWTEVEDMAADVISGGCKNCRQQINPVYVSLSGDLGTGNYDICLTANLPLYRNSHQLPTFDECITFGKCVQQVGRNMIEEAGYKVQKEEG